MAVKCGSWKPAKKPRSGKVKVSRFERRRCVCPGGFDFYEAEVATLEHPLLKAHALVKDAWGRPVMQGFFRSVARAKAWSEDMIGRHC